MNQTLKLLIAGIIFVATLFLFFLFFRYIGVKGILGFVAGMVLMAYLLLSKNPLLRALISFSSAEYYLDDILKKK